MPTIKTLSQLFQAIAVENWPRAEALAAEICKAEDRLGHHTAARLLRGSLSGSSQWGSYTNGRGSNGSATVAGMLLAPPAVVRLDRSVKMSQVELLPSVRRELTSVLNEWRHRDRLQKRGLRHRSRLLFHGPPGCGKSYTALALGNEAALPVHVVRLNAVMGAFLGQTAMNLRQIFHFAEETPCVLLIDELDALGRRRGSLQDVGELDRVVISLLQELEHATPKGLIVAATNLPRNLDEALWRRFDVTLQFPAPAQVRLLAYAKETAKSQGIQLPERLLRRVRSIRSYAEAARLVEDEARRQVLGGA